MDTPGKPRIMVIDDDRHELDRTLEAIRRLGIRYEARAALGGFEALDYLLGRGRFHERARHPLPDLILLDLGMAPLDGVAVLRVINRAEHLRDIPVVMLYKSEQERERAVRETSETCAYASKPLSPETFHGVLLQAISWTLAESGSSPRAIAYDLDAVVERRE
jgi:two-component system, response regulator